MPHSIRPATEADAPFLAWVMQEASRSHLPFGFWDLAIPGPDEYRLRFIEGLCRATPRSFCHWSGFLIAEIGGEPAAALAGYDDAPRATGELFNEALIEAFTKEGWGLDRLGALGKRIEPFLTCVPEQPSPAWIVEFVATAPEDRGKGLIRELLQAVLARGRERGHTLFQIGVLIGNTPAQRAYEGAGFVVVEEKRDPSFSATFGGDGIRRMLMGSAENRA